MLRDYALFSIIWGDKTRLHMGSLTAYMIVKAFRIKTQKNSENGIRVRGEKAKYTELLRERHYNNVIIITQ